MGFVVPGIEGAAYQQHSADRHSRGSHIINRAPFFKVLCHSGTLGFVATLDVDPHCHQTCQVPGLECISLFEGKFRAPSCQSALSGSPPFKCDRLPVGTHSVSGRPIGHFHGLGFHSSRPHSRFCPPCRSASSNLICLGSGLSACQQCLVISPVT